MIDRLGRCDYFQWSMIKSQPTPITKGGASQSNLHWTFFTWLLLHTVTGSILNSYTDLPFFTGHLGPFIHLGIKLPDEPIKARGVHYSYDIKLLHEKNFIERLDSVKKLINICSSRGISIYGKVTIIKSLIIPKFFYISSLLPVPKEIVKELNQVIFKFLWKCNCGKSCHYFTCNVYENGGLKMIDVESMIKSLQLAWLKSIFQCNNGAWRSFTVFIGTFWGPLLISL